MEREEIKAGNENLLDGRYVFLTAVQVARAISQNHRPSKEALMNTMHYIGFDIHKKTIAFCEKKMDGTIVEQGTIPATRNALSIWSKQ
ncbi:MAG: hypothetical protein U9Q58_07045, partial [Pseudomonadota bacterium]|nr:hypothetical protein [Pseudomonadota bacterium]